jgi:hypothetical protein
VFKLFKMPIVATIVQYSHAVTPLLFLLEKKKQKEMRAVEQVA